MTCSDQCLNCTINVRPVQHCNSLQEFLSCSCVYCLCMNTAVCLYLTVKIFASNKTDGVISDAVDRGRFVTVRSSLGNCLLAIRKHVYLDPGCTGSVGQCFTTEVLSHSITGQTSTVGKATFKDCSSFSWYSWLCICETRMSTYILVELYFSNKLLYFHKNFIYTPDHPPSLITAVISHCVVVAIQQN